MVVASTLGPAVTICHFESWFPNRAPKLHSWTERQPAEKLFKGQRTRWRELLRVRFKFESDNINGHHHTTTDLLPPFPKPRRRFTEEKSLIMARKHERKHRGGYGL